MTLEEVRTLVWDCLRTHLRDPPPIVLRCRGIEVGVAAFAQQRALNPDRAADVLQGYDSVHVRAVIAEFVTAGLLVWGRDSENQTGPPWLQITAFGLQCLQDPRPSPHDRDGYVRQLVRQVPSLDAIARDYLEEALVCLQRGCHRACAVMLGGASETVMLRLIEAFRDALQEPARKQRFVRRGIQEGQIARRFAHLRQELRTVQAGIPQPLRGNLDVQLDGVFTLIRMARNDAGHPSAVATTRDAAHANLLLFPSYCSAVYALIDHLRRNPIP